MESKIPTKTYERSKHKESEQTLSSGELPTEFENVCRLCLKRHEQMYDIFKDDGIVPIVVKIRNLLSLRVEEEDDLPTMICNDCFQEMDEFYKFKKNCIASDVKLRQYLLKKPPKPKRSWTDNVNHLSLEDVSLDPKEQKNCCTIDWDDQVPLAGIILTQIEDTNKRKEPRQITKLQDPQEVDITEDCEEREQIRQSGVINSETLEQLPVECQLHVHEPEHDYDEMPLTQRIILYEKIRDKCIKLSKHKVSRKIVNFETKCETCNKFVPVMWSSEEDSEEDCTHLRESKAYYKCAECAKTFNNFSSLKRHSRVHSGERPFTCELCDHAFSQKESLTRHIVQVHDRVKPFECEYCDKSFALPYLLNAHLRSVHTIRPMYECKKCPKVFTHASGLSRHNNIHKGAGYLCKECDRRFTDPSSFKRHMRVIHKNKSNKNI